MTTEKKRMFPSSTYNWVISEVLKKLAYDMKDIRDARKVSAVEAIRNQPFFGVVR